MNLFNKLAFVPEPKQKYSSIVKTRLPWLILGLLGGTVASIVVSNFENIIKNNLSLAYFLPVIVYMSDAIGTQTETIFVRDLAVKKLSFLKYLLKEIIVGIIFGLILGLSIGVIAKIWLGSDQIALIVGLSMFVNAALAPIIAISIPEFIFKEHADPAPGSGPFATVIQDVISILIYFLIATIVLN